MLLIRFPVFICFWLLFLMHWYQAMHQDPHSSYDTWHCSFMLNLCIFSFDSLWFFFFFFCSFFFLRIQEQLIDSCWCDMSFYDYWYCLFFFSFPFFRSLFFFNLESRERVWVLNGIKGIIFFPPLLFFPLSLHKCIFVTFLKSVFLFFFSFYLYLILSSYVVGSVSLSVWGSALQCIDRYHEGASLIWLMTSSSTWWIFSIRYS